MCDHELNDDCVCVHCGYDAAEAWYYDADRRQRMAEEWDDRGEE